LTGSEDEHSVPDFADVDEDAPTQVAMPDLAGDRNDDDATSITTDGRGEIEEVATVVSVDPAGARAGRPTGEASLDDPPWTPSSQTNTRLVMDVATEPEESTAQTGRDIEGAKEIALPSSREEKVSATGRFGANETATKNPARTIVFGALIFACAMIITTVLLVDRTPPVAPEPVDAPAPLPPVAVGAPAGTVYLTTSAATSDLERRGADLLAAGRFAEAVTLYEALLESEPGREEIEITLDIVRRRAATEGR
jgi:hypothetical protein